MFYIENNAFNTKLGVLPMCAITHSHVCYYALSCALIRSPFFLHVYYYALACVLLRSIFFDANVVVFVNPALPASRSR